jgi:hypothetical protein
MEQKIIYEYNLDKIFIAETVEKYNQFDNSLILPQFYTEVQPVFDNNTHFAVFNEKNQSWDYKELSPFGIFYHKENMAQIEVKSEYDTNYFSDLYTSIKPPVINEGDIVTFNEDKQEWEYSVKGEITLEQELQHKNELLISAKNIHKEYIISKRSNLTDKGTVEYNGDTYSNAQSAKTAILNYIVSLNDVNKGGYLTYPEQKFVQLSKTEFQELALLIQTNELVLRKRQAIALKAIDDSTTIEEVNNIDL